jgi:hypothetical protein
VPYTLTTTSALRNGITVVDASVVAFVDIQVQATQNNSDNNSEDSFFVFYRNHDIAPN